MGRARLQLKLLPGEWRPSQPVLGNRAWSAFPLGSCGFDHYA